MSNRSPDIGLSHRQKQLTYELIFLRENGTLDIFVNPFIAISIGHTCKLEKTFKEKCYIFLMIHTNWHGMARTLKVDRFHVHI